MNNKSVKNHLLIKLTKQSVSLIKFLWQPCSCKLVFMLCLQQKGLKFKQFFGQKKEAGVAVSAISPLNPLSGVAETEFPL